MHSFFIDSNYHSILLFFLASRNPHLLITKFSWYDLYNSKNEVDNKSFFITKIPMTNSDYGIIFQAYLQF